MGHGHRSAQVSVTPIPGYDDPTKTDGEFEDVVREVFNVEVEPPGEDSAEPELDS